MPTTQEYAGRSTDDRSSRLFLTTVVALALVCVGYLVFTAPAGNAAKAGPANAGSALRLETKDALGSGVYVGNGFIVTAGHVTEGVKTIEVVLDNGNKQTGEVLWSNGPDGYDVSLVYAPNLHADAAPLSCSATQVGEDVRVIGNPEGFHFLSSWGKVSGAVTQGEWFTWKSLVALDITGGHGVSGGPVYNDANEVVGIIVSGLYTTQGRLGYSFMVPSTTICTMLGRKTV